ncbi:MAG: hypothetical protein EG828_02160 [Deltaproteobacteria bacterium]|nr:hypothetical protein [Deltaproteobacteria bacterium]
MTETAKNETSVGCKDESLEDYKRKYVDLRGKVREYLQHASTDGRPIRQTLRKELAELVAGDDCDRAADAEESIIS